MSTQDLSSVLFVAVCDTCSAAAEIKINLDDLKQPCSVFSMAFLTSYDVVTGEDSCLCVHHLRLRGIFIVL